MFQNNTRIYTNDNCTGCNRCIAACTVPEANIAKQENGRNKIYIDAAHCINCGKCITVCPHNARDYLDDTDEFLAALTRGEKIAALAAPAIRSNFPQWKNLLGVLRQLGCHQIYDTSFGADICTWAYIRYIQRNNATGMVSQPCPAVVNYIEKHNPAVLSALMPIHSPALCAAIYMRRVAGISGKIAFISPCIAKKDEFSDPNTRDVIQYNVTYKKLVATLQAMGKDYRNAPASEFDNVQHGLGAIYPMPGGLKQNVHALIPETWIYQVEGQPEAKHFLDDYPKTYSNAGQRPFMVDILNCAKGCNLGTGALLGEHSAMDAERYMIHAAKEVTASSKMGRVKRSKRKYLGKRLEEFDKELKLEDYQRKYTNKYIRPISVSPQQAEAAYVSLHKYSDAQRHVDCSSCGYHTCEEMALAIAKGINHPENCVEYHRSVLQIQQQEMQILLEQQKDMAEQLRLSVSTIFDELQENATKTEEAASRVTGIGAEVDGMKEIAVRLNSMMDALNEQLQEYKEMGNGIVSISSMTNLLSLNAAVEAVHAGQYGKGFAVVAEEMKTLSDQSGRSAKEIISSNEQIFPMLEEVKRMSASLDELSGSIAGSTKEILQAVEEMSLAEQRITAAASSLIRGDEISLGGGEPTPKLLARTE